ncbi:hypothetical protein GCM10010278_20340 [Streptomyces melanogenes]|nr:hypothetical protein GCM10010278_20340 [Streptomyces melanogenes]
MIADGGYRGTALITPHRRERGQNELPTWKEEHNASHRQVRARVEHAFARMKTWKILRDCRLKDDGVHHAMSGIARLHNLAPGQQASRAGCSQSRSPEDLYGTSLGPIRWSVESQLKSDLRGDRSLAADMAKHVRSCS